jgi:hypothetical protein
VGGYQQVVASGQAGGGLTMRQPAANSVICSVSSLAASLGSPAAPGAEPLNRFLHVLSNRGLVTQQNGKFVYVGGEKGQQAPAAPATVSSASQSFYTPPSG